MEGTWRVEQWLTDQEIAEIDYAQYWNDEEKEKTKFWYVLDGDFSKMEEHLRDMGLPQDLVLTAEVLRTELGGEVRGVGIDLAAGNLWATPQLLGLGPIEQLYCLEYSRHRLLGLGPRVLRHFDVPKDKVILAVGSFYDLRVGNESQDFVFMSMAFHHADDPMRLLKEIHRVLKPDGVVIIIGEHAVNLAAAYVKNAGKFFISRLLPKPIQRLVFGRCFDARTLIPSPSELLAADPILGDHYYTLGAYAKMFSASGFVFRRVRRRQSWFQSFAAMKKAE